LIRRIKVDFVIKLDMSAIVDEELLEDIQNSVRSAMRDEYGRAARQVMRKLLSENHIEFTEQLREAYIKQHQEFVEGIKARQ